MAILVGVMAPQLIKYIEKSKVSSDTQAADSVHTAVLTAMMDPEVVNMSGYNGNLAQIDICIINWPQILNNNSSFIFHNFTYLSKIDYTITNI